MKALAVLLCGAVVVLVSSDAAALLVGINPNIHNGTGQDAYDFHLEGVIKSTTRPEQLVDFVFPVSDIADFDWTYDGGTITPIAGDLWQYSGSWSGTTPVKTCDWIHIGKYFDVTCRNTFVGLRGWWTDREGNKINAEAGLPGTVDNTWVSDVPLVGFEVDDGFLNGNANGDAHPQTLTLMNQTTMPIMLMNYEAAISPEMIPLANLMEGDPMLERLDWHMVFGEVELAPGQPMMAYLKEITLTIPAGGFMVMRGYARDWETGEYRFFAHAHEAHIPEPGVLALVGVAVLALWRRLRK